MLLEVILLSTLGLALEKYCLPRLQLNSKIILVLSIGLLIISLKTGLYLSSKPLNIYEQLNVGRLISNKELLKLLRNHEILSGFYDAVKEDSYETQCISDSDFLSESLTFYGLSVLITNFLSFKNTSTSRLLLIGILLSLGLEFMILIKSITLNSLIYTQCEQIQILRSIIPGILFAIYLLLNIRQSHFIKKHKDFINIIKNSDKDTQDFYDLFISHGIDEYIDLTTFITKAIDNEAKLGYKPSKFKKICDLVIIIIVVHSIFYKKEELNK
jgi:hypothetical protein